MFPKTQLVSKFTCGAKQLTAYLKLFQTSWPMIPFLCEELMTLFHTLMKRFIKKEVLTSATTTSKLADINVADSKNHQSPQKVDVGFSADCEVKKIMQKRVASDLQVYEFRQQCKSFLVTLVTKLLAKAPIKYKLVQYLSCLDSQLIADLDRSVRKAQH